MLISNAQSYSKFSNCPNNLLFTYFSPRWGSSLEPHNPFWLSCLKSLLIWNCSSAFIFYDLDIWGEYRPIILYNVPQHRLVQCFFVSDSAFTFLQKQHRSEVFLSVCHMRRYLMLNFPCIGHVSFNLLVRWCLPGLSIVKLLFFPL